MLAPIGTVTRAGLTSFKTFNTSIRIWRLQRSKSATKMTSKTTLTEAATVVRMLCKLAPVGIGKDKKALIKGENELERVKGIEPSSR